MSFSTIKNVLIVSKFYSFKENDSKSYFLWLLMINNGHLQNDSLLCVIADEMPKNYTLVIELNK
jgi:hypothetical protein